MSLTSHLLYILLFCCLEFVTCDNQCPANTYNSNGARCSGIWKYQEGFGRCLGSFSSLNKNYEQAQSHCSGSSSSMVLPQSISENDKLHVWRGANSATAETWLRGTRIQVSGEKKDCSGQWPSKETWIPWTWTHFARITKSGEDPWNKDEPKNTCNIDNEKCFNILTNGRWRDRKCADTLSTLCERSFETCNACSASACNSGQYRTTCPAGSTADSRCTDCTNNPAVCPDNNRRFPCTSGTTNTCTGCKTNSPNIQCTAGNWLRPCDRTLNYDNSVCQSCNPITCGDDKYLVLCNPNRMSVADNTCNNCDHSSCNPGFYLTRCTENPLSDTSSCTECRSITCGSGQYWKQCVVGQQQHTCQTCTTTQNCGVGSFRPACTGIQIADIQCSVCTNTITCSVGQYRIPCNGNGQSASTCTSCPPLTTSPEGSTSITDCTCMADYVLHNGGTTCTRCGANPHAVGTVKVGTQCQLCGAGKFRTSLTDGTCTACPAGKFKVLGDAECSSCIAGKYSSSTGAESAGTCTSCKAGQFSAQVAATSNTCSNCLTGTFSVSAAASICSQCSAGYAQPTAGSIHCNTACLPGTRSSAGAANCANCNAGTFQEFSAQSTCTPCTAGKISAAVGARACTQCPAGSVSAQSSMSTCTTCTGAHYVAEAGASVCRLCDAGSARVSSSVCTQCSPGTYVSVPGTSACITCLAVSTTLYTSGVAVAYGSARCRPCPWYEYWGNASSCRRCNPGQYLDRTISLPVCKPCNVIDRHYCENIQTEMQALQYPLSYSSNFNQICKNNFHVHKTQLCGGCGCGLFRPDLSNLTQDTCSQPRGNPRSYLNGHTRSCQECPLNKHINRNVLNRSCDTAIHIEHAQWNEARTDYECVPGYQRTLLSSTQTACEPCPFGTYKDTAQELFCRVCPGNTITRHPGSISLQDCAFCSAGQRLVQMQSTGDFRCESCALCTVTRDAIHMERTCSPCTLYEYDAKIVGHAATCILKHCVKTVRSGTYSNPTRLYNGDPQFAYIAPTTSQDDTTKWADGVLLMFVTMAQWNREIRKQDIVGGDNSDFLDRLNSFATNFQRYSLISLNPPAVVESFRVMRQQGTPIHVSFQDLFFRVLTDMMNASISINLVSGFDTQNYVSHWTAAKQREFTNRVQVMLQIYSSLDIQRLQHETNIQSVRDFQFTSPRKILLLSHNATGTKSTTLQFNAPALGEEFHLWTEISFRGTMLTASMCKSQSFNQDCVHMFVAGSNVLHFNHTHRFLRFIDLSIVFLEDIHFSVLAANGANSLKFHMSNAISEYVRPDTTPDVMFAILDWRQQAAVYRACEQDESISKHATITDPWVFTRIRTAFHSKMCSSLDYAKV